MKNQLNKLPTDDFQFEKILSQQWLIQSSTKLELQGAEISSNQFDPKGWYQTSVPSTVLATLVENDVYKDLYFGLNLKKISSAPFKTSWWYRKEFYLDEVQVQGNVMLQLDGINYRANVWLNGQQIASSDEVEGPFRRFEFDISGFIQHGKNIVAVEVFPPQRGQFSIGFVDWNPAPPDQNMGIFRPVTLLFNRGVSINNPYVQTKVNDDTLEEAWLTVSAELVNHTNQTIDGILTGEIENISFSQHVILNPTEKKLITFEPNHYKQLNFKKPRLWWLNNLGEANLYELDLKFLVNEQLSDRKRVTFGIREITDYFNEGGHRGFKLNGKKVLIKGGGWTDDLFLGDTPERLEAQLRYVKHINLNAIRLEGFWGNDQTLYDLCDRYGILIMVGWSCHWEHEQYVGKVCDEKYGGVLTQEEIDLVSQSFQDQVIWLRNHPSIFLWTVGSDKLPKPELERKYVEILDKYDGTRTYLASTGGVGSETGVIVDALLESEISGPTGVKMLGPYAYTPPVYWHTDRKLGGAYGFNTETGPGAQVPPLESLKKMIPEDHLWSIDEYWNFHCAENEFSTLDRYISAINNRYGEVNSVEEFVKKAQVLNYELMRPMFEAFQANKFEATGVIQWMLNSAWPKMYWQLYDHFLMPNGAFYGAKKACSPLHILYRYAFHDLYLVNDYFYPLTNLTVVIRIFDIYSKELFKQTVVVDIGENESKHIFQLPGIDNLTTTYFLDLRLYNANDEELDSNFYWLSTKPDVLDYEADVGDFGFYTPSKAYADMTLLNKLPNVEVRVEHSFKQIDDTIKADVTLENLSNAIAFFIDLHILRKQTGETILPVFWEDNYVSLLPGEKRKIQGSVYKKDLNNDEPVLIVTAWNL